MTLERRVEALATTVAQQQAVIVQMQALIADMQGASGTGWSLRAKGEVSLGDAGVFGGVITAAPNQAAEEVVAIITEQIKTSKLYDQLS
ncbi:hypothetical protein [Leclercia adecarboxylata]|uniref:hypothetical protein n=1 Tax=Leclercia adecarboxylata TaxID=83655 RepID=UPI00301686F8